MAKYKKVLLVDDDDLTIIISSKLMKFVDFTEEIISFTNCEDAYNYVLDILSGKELNNIPEIILLDLNMQGMTGWDFLDKFKLLTGLNTDLPIVNIFSSTIADEDKNRAKSYEFVKHFLRKPLTVEHLRLL